MVTIFKISALLAGCASALTINHTISGAPYQAIHAVQPANQPHAIPNADIQAKFKTAKVGNRFRDGNTVFIYKGTKGDFVKRQQQCYPVYYQAVQVPDGQTGTWWGSWEPAAGCIYGGDSTGSQCRSISTSVTTSWTASAGFDTGLAGDVLDIINAHASFNFGLTWGYSTSTSDTISCCPNQGDVGQIWSQSQYGWSNSQEQTCFYSSCSPGLDVSCGAWSAYQHADWALPDGLKTINYGCSTGSNNVRC